MPITRGCPIPRSTWSKCEERAAICKYTLPHGVAMKTWRHVRALVEKHALPHPEHIFAVCMRNAAGDIRRHALISARHGAEMMASIPTVPGAERLCAIITASVFDTWNTRRYPCYTDVLRCYTAKYGDGIEWYNSGDLSRVRQQAKEYASDRERDASYAAALLLNAAVN